MTSIRLLGGPHHDRRFDVPDSTRAVKLLDPPDGTVDGRGKKLPPLAHFYTSSSPAIDGRDFTYQGYGRGDSGGSYHTIGVEAAGTDGEAEADA